MRISDWSSDVCSSDLPAQRRAEREYKDCRAEHAARAVAVREPAGQRDEHREAEQIRGDCEAQVLRILVHRARILRSEEHTSELQSLMRNSYAVFCLTKYNVQADFSNRHEFISYN